MSLSLKIIVTGQHIINAYKLTISICTFSRTNLNTHTKITLFVIKMKSTFIKCSAPGTMLSTFFVLFQ